MTERTQVFERGDWSFGAAGTIPGPVRTMGSEFPVEGLAFDAGTNEQAFLQLAAQDYGQGNVTVRIEWYADTASSGDVVFGASLAAITPNTDTQDIETKAFDAENTVTDTHLGTTGQRLHSCDIAVPNLDSLANGDAVWLRIRRLGADGADTMTGDAIITRVKVLYSDV